jgi:hypothetical protein
MPIPWSFDATGAPPLDDLEQAVAAAFDTWSWVEGTDVAFVPHDVDSASDESAHDLVNVVWFDAAWPEDEPAIALASTWATADGALLGFDIRLDAFTDWSTTGDAGAYDLQAALTHEIGHTLGLEHSDLEDATMFGVHARGEDWRRALHPDDEDALHHMYGQRTLEAGAHDAFLDGATRLSDATGADLPASCATAPVGLSAARAILLVLLSIRVRRRFTAG